MSYSDTPPPPPPPPPPPGAGAGGFDASPGAPSFTLATFGQRALASLLDTAIYTVGFLVVFVIALILSQISEGLAALVSIPLYLGVIVFAFWQLWVQGETGQTMGKKVIGIALVRQQDAQHVGGLMSIVRSFLHVVDSIPCYVGYLWPLWDQKRQTFADMIMKTVVVDRPKS